MAIARVFVSDLGEDLGKDLGNIQVNSILELPKEASHHIIRVCRYKLGDKIILFDDSMEDAQYLCEIEQASKVRLVVKVLQKQVTFSQSSCAIDLYPGLTKAGSFEWLLQKSVELGVRSITPVLTQRTQVSFDQKKLVAKVSSWQKLVISACEQCGLNIVPKVNHPIKLKDLLSADKVGVDGLRLVGLGPLEVSRVERLKVVSDFKALKVRDLANIIDKSDKQQKIILLTGPEGGFSEEEIIKLCSEQFKVISLGARVLRMETAPLVLLSLLQGYFGDF